MVPPHKRAERTEEAPLCVHDGLRSHSQLYYSAPWEA